MAVRNAKTRLQKLRFLKARVSDGYLSQELVDLLAKLAVMSKDDLSTFQSSLARRKDAPLVRGGG